MLEQQLANDLISLKRCKRFYTIAMWTEAALIIAYLLVTVFIMLGTVIQHDSLFLVFDSLLFCPLTFYLAMRGIIKRNDFSALILPLIFGANQVILGISRKYVSGEMFVFFKFRSVDYCFWIHLAVAVICSILAIINLFANHKYRFLEEQPGFPYFNIRAVEMEAESRKIGSGRAFQNEYEQMKRTSTPEMSDISAAVPMNDLCGNKKDEE